MKTNKLQYKIPFFQVRMKEKKLVKEIIVVSCGPAQVYIGCIKLARLDKWQ